MNELKHRKTKIAKKKKRKNTHSKNERNEFGMANNKWKRKRRERTKKLSLKQDHYYIFFFWGCFALFDSRSLTHNHTYIQTCCYV